MSIKAIKWAIEQPIDSHGAKLLLVVIANYADENGRAWPGQKTLRHQVRATRKSIIRWISELERAGYLTTERRGGDGEGRKPNIYKLAIEQSPPQDTLPQEQSPPGDTGKVPLMTRWAKSPSGPSKVPLVTHEPLEEPSEKNPSPLPPSLPDGEASDRAQADPAPSPAEPTTAEPPRTEPRSPPQRDPWTPPDWINRAAWDEYEQHRREMKKPLSDLARTKAANQLRELDHEEQQRCIDTSIQARWAGLFPDKAKSNAAHQHPDKQHPETRGQRHIRLQAEIENRATRWIDPERVD